MQHTEPSAVERSLAMYRRLLRAYPIAFRDQYGDEMARVFRDAARAAWRGAGFASLIALWARTLTDTLVNATRERVRGSDEGVAMSCWEVFAGKVRTNVLPLAGAFVYVALPLAVLYGVMALTHRWLSSLPPTDRGWAVLIPTIILGFLLGLAASRRYRVTWWNCCMSTVGTIGWVVWLITSTQLGLAREWATILSWVPMVSVWWSDNSNETDTEWISTIGRRHQLVIAIPALLLLITSPAPYVATNVFLLFVVVVNGIAAMLPRIELKARKGDVDAK